MTAPSLTPDKAAKLPIGQRELYEAGRAYGRREADNAIAWHTSCTGCAAKLDQHAAGFFDGERSGLAAALRAIADCDSIDPATRDVIAVVRDKVARLAAAYESPKPS